MMLNTAVVAPMPNTIVVMTVSDSHGRQAATRME
jgi:hypothetical protein